MGELATRQHGVVSRGQLTELGFGRGAIARRRERGWLHPVHRGVFAVGHRSLTPFGRWMAAALAADGDLSHRAGAALWGLRCGGGLEVTVPTERRTRPGITIHVSALPPDERTVHKGIPVTTVPRTLLDLAAVLPRHGLERALHEAEFLRLGDPVPLTELIARHPGRRGVATLRTLVAAGDLGATITRSELEDRFLLFLDRHGLPRPITNVPVAGREVDCLWREERLVVELDGRAAHSTARAFERDRAGDRALLLAGHRVVRVTGRALAGAPAALAQDLRRLLGTV